MAKMAKAAASAGTGHGHHAVGKVVILNGTVKAISADGTVRILGPNSLVFADDQIITESDGSVSLILDGTPPIHVDLGRMSQIVLDEDVYGGAGTSADAAADADRIQALLAGDQPINPEAPAAGGAADSGGGHPIVNYALTGEEVTPESGAETRGIEFAPLETVDEGDTVPIGGDDLGAVDDEGLCEGNLGGDGSDDPTNDAFIAGNLSYDFGADGPAGDTPFVWSMAGLEAMGVESHGHTLLYEVVDGGLTLNAYYMDGIPELPGVYAKGDFIQEGPHRVDVFSLELTNVDTGAYKFTLFEPLDHATPGTEDDINYIFGYALEDGDGSTGSGVLRMLVDDDTPVMGEGYEHRTVDEDDINTCLSDGNWPNDGACHDGSITGHSDWWLHDLFDPFGPANTWGSLAGVVAFGADGPAECGGFSFAADLSSLDDQNLTSHGDDLSYRVEGNTLIAFVGEFDDEGPLDDLISTKNLNLQEYREVFTLEMDSFGNYHFSLYDQIDHDEPEGEDRSLDVGENGRDTTIPIDFAGIIVATDFDGDPVTLEEGKFVINITDDVPTCAGYDVVITEDEQNAHHGGINEHGDHLTGWVAGTIVNDARWGADGFLDVKEFRVGDETFDTGDTVYWNKYGKFLGEDGEPDAARTTIPDGESDHAASLVVNGDGTYTFTLLNNMLLGQGVQGEQTDCLDTVAVIGRDYDGDEATIDLYLKVDDDVPTAGCTAATLDDEGLKGGIPGGPGDVSGEAIVVNGTLPHNFGADGEGSVTFAAMNGDHGMVGTENVVYHWSGDTLTAVVDGGARNGTELFTVEVNPTSGEYTVTQLDNVLHQPPICIDTTNYLSNTDLVQIKVGVSHNENASNVYINHQNAALFVSAANGFGVTSAVDGGDTGRYDELNNMFGDHQSEVMIFSLQGDRIANTATVDMTYFYQGENMGGAEPGDEKGVYSLFKDGHQVQGPTIFTANSTDGTYTLNINCAGGFDEIRLGAVTGSNDPASGDSSDYYIKTVTFDQPYENDATVKLTYTVTDGDGDREDGMLTLTFDDDVPTAANSQKTITLDTLSVNDLDAGFIDWDPSSAVTGNYPDLHDALADQLRWGQGQEQSGYNLDDVLVYTDVSGSAITDGEAFKIADFTHINQPISGTALDDTDLKISMDVVVNGQSQTVTFEAYLDHDETPNPEADHIKLDYQTANVTIDGDRYQVELLGFGTDPNHIVHQIDTAEGKDTTYGVWAKVTQIESLSNEGDLDWSPGADGGHIMEIRTSIDGKVVSDSIITSDVAGDYDLALETAFGKLEVQSDTGHYRYTPDASTSGNHTENFSFTVIDGDGDRASADLSILINDPNNDPN